MRLKKLFHIKLEVNWPSLHADCMDLLAYLDLEFSTVVVVVVVVVLPRTWIHLS